MARFNMRKQLKLHKAKRPLSNTKKIVLKCLAWKLVDFCLVPEDIDGFFHDLIYALLFAKMWHSLGIRYVVMILTAHLIVENAVFHFL